MRKTKAFIYATLFALVILSVLLITALIEDLMLYCGITSIISAGWVVYSAFQLYERLSEE